MNAKEIQFNNITLYAKLKSDEFELTKFKVIYNIDNLEKFWSIFQNINFESIIQHEFDLFFSLKSPIWNPNNASYSFILSKSCCKTSNEVWSDIGLYFIQQLLNLGSEDCCIEGISLTLKGRTKNIFNVKIVIRGQKDVLDFSSIPDYFGNYHFKNNTDRVLLSSQRPPRPPMVITDNHYRRGHQRGGGYHRGVGRGKRGRYPQM